MTRTVVIFSYAAHIPLDRGWLAAQLEVQEVQGGLRDDVRSLQCRKCSLELHAMHSEIGQTSNEMAIPCQLHIPLEICLVTGAIYFTMRKKSHQFQTIL